MKIHLWHLGAGAPQGSLARFVLRQLPPAQQPHARHVEVPRRRRAHHHLHRGVAPTGHPRPLRTLVDEDLRAHEEVWAAGGTPDTVFPLSFEQLVALTGGTVATVR